MSLSLFVTCPKGLEELLTQELTSFGATSVRQTVAGVHAEGDLAFAYRCCLWSRLANRVLLPLGSWPAPDADAIYRAAAAVPWEQHFDVDSTFAIDFIGTSQAMVHSHFGAQKVKDGIVDRFRDRFGRRPSVERDRPDLRISAVLRRESLTLSLDLSGGSLHRRAYRLEANEAPLKENLAAALLMRAGWLTVAESGGALVDPMCGSGTLLAEALLMALDVAPGIARQSYGFKGWLGHDAALWQSLFDEAVKRRDTGMKRQVHVYGYDQDGRALAIARDNLRRAGVLEYATLAQRDISALTCPVDGPGLLITNPPYGVRLSDEAGVLALYRELGARLRTEFRGWRAAIFTSRPEFGKELAMRSTRQYSLFNGAMPCKLLMFDVNESYFYRDIDASSARPLSEGAQMFANRLRKNIKRLEGWLKRSGEQCYRLYDADMPEYALAIDVYGDQVHVQEYAPPATVDLKAADRRLREALSAIQQVLALPHEQIVLKQRRRQRGDEQYSKVAKTGVFREVREGKARLLINLNDYLDTGLFLDHRPVRRMLGEMAKGKRFLNLFCYTGTATVHAALGGAISSLSVDLSRTYLDWSWKNFNLNGLDPAKHRLEQADCLAWLKQAKGQFDLIFLDPPTFSNSKRADNVLDVQRDHLQMVQDCMRLLAPEGVLVFSNNFRKFKLDPSLEEQYRTEEITRKSFDPDFERDQKLHRCWLIRHPALI